MNAIAVLANNLEFIGYMVNNIPKDLLNTKWIFVNETRIGNKIKEIDKLLKKSNLKDYEIIDSDKILSKFKEDIINNDFVESYTMGMNILMVWYLFKYNNKIDKLLLVDDDVLFFEGANSIFDLDENSFVQYRLSAGGTIFNDNSKNFKRTMHEWFKIFEIKDINQDWWENIYLKRNLSSGNRMIVRKCFDIKKI